MPSAHGRPRLLRNGEGVGNLASGGCVALRLGGHTGLPREAREINGTACAVIKTGTDDTRETLALDPQQVLKGGQPGKTIGHCDRIRTDRTLGGTAGRNVVHVDDALYIKCL